jgi:hypothetical protein
MMGNAADSTQKSSSESGSTGAARDYSEQQQVISDIKPAIDQWQARIDAAKLQMHLGAREARAKLQPHVEKLEQDLGRVKASWAQLEESSENAWKDTQHGLKISLLALRRSYDKAKQHFENPDHS